MNFILLMLFVLAIVFTLMANLASIMDWSAKIVVWCLVATSLLTATALVLISIM